MFYINAIHHGGAERVMVNLAKQFANDGTECILVTSFVDTWEYPVDPTVKRISLYKKQIGGFIRRNLKLTSALRRLIREERPDLLITFMAEPNFRGIFACAGLKTKNLISIRNDPTREYAGHIQRFLAKTLFRKADGVVFQTEEAKEWFPKRIQKKSKVIFNQVDLRFYTTPPDEKKKQIVTTGRLVPQKNHKLLIEAFCDISDQIEETLWIYGDGPLKEELSALIEERGLQNRVFLPGATKDVSTALASAELFVLSSDFEGMPNALMEAMALGLPCISTDCPCGGPRALFGDELKECLYPVNNSARLSELLLSLLKNQSKLDELGQLAKKKAEAFNPKTIFAEWNQFILSLIK